MQWESEAPAELNPLTNTQVKNKRTIGGIEFMFKSHVNLVLTVLIITSVSGIAFSQDNQQKTPTPCQAPEARQFDFWVGEWELSWPAEQWGGKQGEKGEGSNHITKQLDGCVVQENFQFPMSNFNGNSVSVYNPKKKVWQQTWVDNQGGYLVFTGKFKNGKMELRTQPHERDGKTYISRMVFKNIKANSLDWDWQRSFDGGKTWTDLWNIHYERKK